MPNRRLTLSAALLAATLSMVAAGPALADTATFRFTGAEQTYTVPAGAHSIHVTAIGAKGGKGSDSVASKGGPGGAGGRVDVDLAVQPGQVLFIEVGGVGGNGALGGEGAGGFNGGGRSASAVPGGGGGGATDIRSCSIAAFPCTGAADSLASRLLVAGGGGGGGSLGLGAQASGGEGGAANANGNTGQNANCNPGNTPGGGGGAGGQGAGGAGGLAGNNAGPGSMGVLGFGGSSGVGVLSIEAGGGGGGGFFGGGGGGSADGCAGGGGGGGSSFAGAGASNVSMAVDSTDPASVAISLPTTGAPPTGAPPSGPPPNGKPSNAFHIGSLKRNRRKGTGLLAVDLPGPGVLSLTGKGLAKQQLTLSVAGTVGLPIRPAGKAKRVLSFAGQVKTTARITFTPTGGDPDTETIKARLVKAF
jgi:hypothetical protein